MWKNILYHPFKYQCCALSFKCWKGVNSITDIYYEHFKRKLLEYLLIICYMISYKVVWNACHTLYMITTVYAGAILIGALVIWGDGVSWNALSRTHGLTTSIHVKLLVHIMHDVFIHCIWWLILSADWLDLSSTNTMLIDSYKIFPS